MAPLPTASPTTVSAWLDRYEVKPGGTSYESALGEACSLALTARCCMSVVWLGMQHCPQKGTFEAVTVQEAYDYNREIVAECWPGGFREWNVSEVAA